MHFKSVVVGKMLRVIGELFPTGCLHPKFASETDPLPALGDGPVGFSTRRRCEAGADGFLGPSIP